MKSDTPTRRSRVFWFFRCVNCLRWRWPGMYRQCSKCRRDWDPFAGNPWRTT